MRGLLSVLGLLVALAVLAPLTACSSVSSAQTEPAAAQQPQKGLVILYFWGQKCASCKVQSEEIAKFQQVSKVPVIKSIPDKNAIAKYNLTRTPTLVFLKDGRVVKTTTGVSYDYDLKAITKQIESGTAGTAGAP